MKKGLYYISLFLLVSSCISEYEAVVEKAHIDAAQSCKTKSVDTYKLDSLILIYIRQTDPELRMADMIYYRDSSYHIGITLSDAKEIGINESIFNTYCDFVNEVNKSCGYPSVSR